MSKMKCQIRSGNNYIVGEGDTPLEVFENISALFEVFGDNKCRACGSEDIVYRVRTASDKKGKVFKFPEAICQNSKCRAKLSYGQTDNGVIYPKRYKMNKQEYILDSSGNKIVSGNWGWVKYEQSNQDSE